MVCGSSGVREWALAVEPERGWLRGNIDAIDVIALPLPYSNRDGLPTRTITFLRFAMRSLGIALRSEYDLVFATSTPLTAALPGIVAKVFRRKPFVFEVRDLWPELPRALGMSNPILLTGMSLLEWLAYRVCDRAIGLSPGIVEGIRRRSPRSLPITLIPNGCDLELFDPRVRAPVLLPGISAGDFVAGFTGAHGVANGLDAVLDAAAVLQRRGKSNIKLVFVGDGKEKSRLGKRAGSEGLENCRFYAPMPKVQIASQTAALGCGLMILKNVPAFYYGTSPNKFFDYVAAGIPVVCNDPGWLADLIGANSCGLAVQPVDPEALAEALIKLAEDAALCRDMGARGRQLGEREFDRDKLGARFCDVIERG